MAGDFSDEELTISDDEWQSLEHNAILSTQQQQEASKSSRKGAKSVQNGQKESSSLRKAALNGRLQHNIATKIPAGDSFDDPELDEDGIPTVIDARNLAYVPHRRLDDATLKEQWRAQRYAESNGYQAHPSPRPVTPLVQQGTHQKQTTQNGTTMQQPQAAPASAMPTSTQGFEVVQKLVAPYHAMKTGANDLQAQLDRLMREKADLQKSLDVAQNELFTAKGEITVVRSKNVSDQKAADRHMAALKAQMQEELSKQAAVLKSKDAAVTELRTNNNFLKHELSEQTRRAQALQRQSNQVTAPSRNNSIINSPRRTSKNHLQDGFSVEDDDGIMLNSPTRGASPVASPTTRRISKPFTPTKKRKHPTAAENDSRNLPIRLSQPHKDEQATVENVDQDELEPEVDYQKEDNLSLLKSVLAFCPEKKSNTIVESLVQFHFPTDQSRPLSSLLLAETSSLNTERFASDLFEIFANLLVRCWKEQYYAPSLVLLRSLDCILDHEPMLLDSSSIDLIVPVVSDLLQINGKVRWTCADRNQIWDEQNPKPQIVKEVDVAACLNTLITVAALVMDDNQLIKQFWSLMAPEVVLLMLAPCQPIPDLGLMLELVSTSILPETFGCISAPEDQPQMEVYVVDKLCYLLWDPPKVIMKHTQDWLARQREKRQPHHRRRRIHVKPAAEPEEPELTRTQICNFRMKVLDVLAKVAVTSLPHPHNDGIESHHGTTLILFHPAAIARLTRLIDDEVRNLYFASEEMAPLHAALINRSIAILHHLLLSPQAISKDSKFDLQKSLKAVLAGGHRFRVAMSRITFREGVAGAIDEAITDDTVLRANEILEEYITPDEAVQLLEAFGKNEVEEDEEMVDEDAEAEAANMAVDE